MYFAHIDMFASVVSRERCELFTVVRTDLATYEQRVLTYPPSDYLVAVHRAAEYQRTFDPGRKRVDYRVAHFG